VRQAGDENPTQILEGGAGRRDDAATVTDALSQPRPTAAQEPLRAFQQTVPLAPSFTRGGRAKWWVIPFIFVVALACIGVLLMKRAQTPVQKVVIRKGGLAETGTIVPPIPPMPPGLPQEAREAIEKTGAMMPLDESGAKVSGDRTVVTETFELGRDVTFSMLNAGGEVTIEGWDKEDAEIKITKRGGSDVERRAVPIMLSRGEERVSLLNPTAVRGAAAGTAVSVSYEIKVPRTLRQLEITSDQSEVRVKGLEGGVLVDVKSGKLSFDGLTGPVRGKLIKGDILVTRPVNSHRDAQEFTVVSGNVNVIFGGHPNADLKAETMDGDIEIAPLFPQIEVVKRPVGRHAIGRLGDGDSPLLIKVVNGDIRLKN
jgi:hypothetical protein